LAKEGAIWVLPIEPEIQHDRLFSSAPVAGAEHE
jgi:hypothetical protein